MNLIMINYFGIYSLILIGERSVHVLAVATSTATHKTSSRVAILTTVSATTLIRSPALVIHLCTIPLLLLRLLFDHVNDFVGNP